jgi:hypothetical protein
LTDLSPLRGLKLTLFYCRGTSVADLSPLSGMPLASVECRDTLVADLSALETCKSLGALNVVNTKVTPTQVAALQKALPQCKIEWDDPFKTPPAT